jgi:beta-lactamase class A
MKPKLIASICIICLVVGFFVGFNSDQYFNFDEDRNPTSEIRGRRDYQYINPLLECDTSFISQEKIFDSLRDQLQTLIKSETKINSHVNFVSVYYRDLNNGPWIGINHNELFSPASLIKVPVMMAYYKEAGYNPAILEKKVLNTKSYEPGTQNIVPEVTLTPNQEYTIDELINNMIIYSDNNAYELLLENIDTQKVYQVYKDLGVDITEAESNPSGNILSVKNYAAFFRILYNASYLNTDMSEKALRLLSQIKFTKGLKAGIPSDVNISHKFGERQYLSTGEKQLHDCGIVYHPTKPYLICIMTRGNDFTAQTNMIKKISASVYNYINK